MVVVEEDVMGPGRIAALIIGFVLVAPGVGMVFGGGAMALVSTQRDVDGYATTTVALASGTAAITTHDVTYHIDANTPGWVLDALETDVRLEVVDAAGDVFVGIAPASEIDGWLSGVSHDQIADVGVATGDVTYRTSPGTDGAGTPVDQPFWVASTSSSAGADALTWTLADGDWVVVVMNADGSPGVVADVQAGLRSGFLLPLGVALVGLGVLVLAAAVGLIVFGATGPQKPDPERDLQSPAPAEPTAMATAAPSGLSPTHPLSLEAHLDPDLSRWQWLVKWALAIPHFIVLAVLWMAFVVLTVVAGVSILFTGSYPRGIFDFNAGVLRWTWRVSYYATTGGIGTDNYPPFTLARDPDFPATLDVTYPTRLSRGLVLVKWWLLALPQYLVVALLIGTVRWFPAEGNTLGFDPTGGAGILGLLVLVAGLVLLFTGSYSRPLFDLIVGLNRWVFRVIAYAALMTDQYPPFRLDQGGSEPRPDPPPPHAAATPHAAGTPAPEPAHLDA